MLLAVDIGNSFTKFGLFDGETPTSKFSIPTKRDSTVGEIKLAIGDRLPDTIGSAIVCSVVPELEAPIRAFLQEVKDVRPVFVNNSFNFGLRINYEPLESLGTDRLVAAYAAVEKYGSPAIVCSLGTATTIDVVSADGEFLGGMIAPGLDTMADALHLKAAKLPRVTIRRPERLFGNSTVESIQSGVYYGYVEMVRGLIARCASGLDRPLKIVTGGNAGLVDGIADATDPDLVLTGLRLLAKSAAPNLNG